MEIMTTKQSYIGGALWLRINAKKNISLVKGTQEIILSWEEVGKLAGCGLAVMAMQLDKGMDSISIKEFTRRARLENADFETYWKENGDLNEMTYDDWCYQFAVWLKVEGEDNDT